MPERKYFCHWQDFFLQFFMIIFFIFFRLLGSHHMSVSLLDASEWLLASAKAMICRSRHFSRAESVLLRWKMIKWARRTFCLLSRKLRSETAKALLTRRCVLTAARDPLLGALVTLGKCFSLAKIAMEIFFKGARLVGKSLCNSKEKKTRWLDCSTRIHLN